MAIWIHGLFSEFVAILGDMESGINRLCCATLQCRACTSRHRHSNYDVIKSPAHDRQPCQPVMVTDVATLLRPAFAEVCTVPVLLVFNEFDLCVRSVADTRVSASSVNGSLPAVPNLL